MQTGGGGNDDDAGDVGLRSFDRKVRFTQVKQYGTLSRQAETTSGRNGDSS